MRNHLFSLYYSIYLHIVLNNQKLMIMMILFQFDVLAQHIYKFRFNKKIINVVRIMNLKYDYLLISK